MLEKPLRKGTSTAVFLSFLKTVSVLPLSLAGAKGCLKLGCPSSYHF